MAKNHFYMRFTKIKEKITTKFAEWINVSTTDHWAITYEVSCTNLNHNPLSSFSVVPMTFLQCSVSVLKMHQGWVYPANSNRKGQKAGDSQTHTDKRNPLHSERHTHLHTDSQTHIQAQKYQPSYGKSNDVDPRNTPSLSLSQGLGAFW